MLDRIITKNYPPPPIDGEEIYRYAGGKGEGVDELLSACLQELSVSCRVCYLALEKESFFSLFSRESKLLNLRLKNSKYVLVFATTLGLEIDRLIMRYGKISPAKALLFQAIGAERIESLCNLFCEDIAKECEKVGLCTTDRFSPGYGDFPLEEQTKLFTLLDCPRRIGLTLLDGGLMSPTKSVTAVLGIEEGKENTEKERTCRLCGKLDCAYRKDEH